MLKHIKKIHVAILGIAALIVAGGVIVTNVKAWNPLLTDEAFKRWQVENYRPAALDSIENTHSRVFQEKWFLRRQLKDSELTPRERIDIEKAIDKKDLKLKEIQERRERLKRSVR